MLTSSALPTLSGSATSLHMSRSVPSTQSSAYMKLRRLLAVAPDLDLAEPRELRRDHLAADRGRRLLAPAVVRSVRPVDVVVARDAGDEAEVLGEVVAHALAEQLLPPVAVLGLGRVRVGLPERRDLDRALAVDRVDAGRRGVEVPLDTALAGGHQEVRVDQHREHAARLVGLDEAHAAHVGREVEDRGRAVRSGLAVLQQAEIEHDVLDALVGLVPVVDRLDVDGPDPLEPADAQLGDEVPADEAAGAGDQDEPVGVHECITHGH